MRFIHDYCDYSRDTHIAIIADYSTCFLITEIIRIIPIIDKACNHMSKSKRLYACLAAVPLICAVAEWSEEDDIPHADQVLSLHSHDSAIQDAPPPASRQRVVAHVLPMSLSQVVRDMSARDPIKALDKFCKNYISYSQQTIATFPYTGTVERELQKRKADHISRSESEVFSFLTHNTTSQERSA